MEGINLIQDLGLVLLAAALAATLCKRIGLSVIVGYLLAGILIGPHTPPFSLLLDVDRIETLSQVGLVFLMFGIGLGLSLSKFRQMGVATLIATGLGALLVLNLIRLVGLAVGWTPAQSLFIAAMFMVSSSAVIAKIIQDMKLSHDRAAQMAMSITVQEDVVAVVMLAVLATQGGGAGTAGQPSIGALLIGLFAFVVLLVSLGLSFMPRLLRRLEARADPEIRTIMVAGLLFLIALAAVKSGYSLALGAFLLGAIIADMPQKASVEKAFGGARDMFSSVFFVSIGLMIDVRLVAEAWLPILGLGMLILVMRPVATGIAMMAVGVPLHQARRAGLLLSPIGEFSFLIAQLGVSMAVLPEKYYPIAVGVSVLTVFLAPLINRQAEPLLALIERAEPRWLKRALETYHGWLAQLGGAGNGRLWWQLSRKRVLQIAIELLFVTGLLAFSELILAAVQRHALAAGISPTALQVAFWSILGLVVLVPLVAIWRNLSALALIFAETASGRTRLPARLIEAGFKIAAGIGLAHWLAVLLPLAVLPRWAWLLIAAALAGVLIVFSRRLVYLHSEWQHRLGETLAAAGAEEATGTQRLLTEQADWPLNVQDYVLPTHAACAGRTLTELSLRSRFGCSIAEIDRQGFVIIAPDSGQALYPGDRLLLLGEPEAIARARDELGRETAEEASADFSTACLEVVPVPDARATPAATLADFGVARRLGVLVAGIERDGQKIPHPEPSQPLASGDSLLVLGPPEKIRVFRRWLAGDDLATHGAPAAKPA